MDLERDQPCLSVASPSVSPCCLTSFPLLLYLIRDPVLQCGNEACVRRAAPLGIQAPHTSGRGREARAYRSYIVSLNPTASACVVLPLHCISVHCSLMCCHEKQQVKCCCVCMCACALTCVHTAVFCICLLSSSLLNSVTILDLVLI